MIAMCVDGPLAEEVIELNDSSALPEYDDGLLGRTVEYTVLIPVARAFQAAAAPDAYEYGPSSDRAEYRLVERWWDMDVEGWFGKMEFVR